MGVVDVDGQAVVARSLGVVVPEFAAHGVGDGLDRVAGAVPAHLDHAEKG